MYSLANPLPKGTARCWGNRLWLKKDYREGRPMTRIISATCGEPREGNRARHNFMTPRQHDTQHSRNLQAEPPNLPPGLHHPSHRMELVTETPTPTQTGMTLKGQLLMEEPPYANPSLLLCPWSHWRDWTECGWGDRITKRGGKGVQREVRLFSWRVYLHTIAEPALWDPCQEGRVSLPLPLLSHLLLSGILPALQTRLFWFR